MNRISLLIACAVASPLFAADPGYFEFPLKWDDTSAGVITDVSFLNTRPAGANGKVIARDGHFIEEKTGKRIRFFATNIGAGEAFPDKADAELIARRLAKAGINMVRLHHLDNPWGIQAGDSIWDPSRPDRQQLSPEALDKLDYLVHCLKEQGIFINMNLKVSKELTEADLPGISQVKFVHQKRIDMFQERMIELQKDYARKLLGHRNPYTKLTYAEDPAIAVVEINNENSLTGFWTSTLGKDLDQLPEPFLTELATKWTSWLKAKYGTDEKLAQAWVGNVEPLGDSIVTSQSTWVAEQHAPAAMSITPTAAAPDAAPTVHATISAVSGTDWHLQLKLEGLTLEEGKVYTLSFTGRANANRTVRVEARKDIAEWHNMGLTESIRLTPEGKPFEFTFVATDTDPGHTRISFTVGNSEGEIWLSDLKLAPGAKNNGMREGDSLQTLVSIPASGTKQQWADWVHFLADTERAYSDQMLSVLKDELKVQANVNLTQVDYGGTTGLHREQKMDLADTHAYWQHPSFPRASWSPTDWTIANTPQIASLSDSSFGVLQHLAIARVAGKPFSVSEYDHPAPSDFAAEMMPSIATFACVQDWDAIYTFAIADYGADGKPDRITGFFDQNNHPAKWCAYPAAALIFRQGLIEPASEVITLRLPEPIWSTSHMFAGAWKSVLGDEPFSLLTRRVQVSDRPLAPQSKPMLDKSGDAGSAAKVVKASNGNVLSASSPSAAVLVGFIGGAELTAGDVSLSADSFEGNFAAVSVVATDQQPLASSKRILITSIGRVQNQEMGWNETRTSVSNQWGHGPAVAQFVPITLSIPAYGPRSVYALDATGARKETKVESQFVGGKLTVKSLPEHETLLYELVAQ